MLNDESVVRRLVARVRALFGSDWLSRAGAQFRVGTQALSDFAEQNRLLPEDLLQEGVELGRRKVEGLASHEHAGAKKNYAEAIKAIVEIEDKKIDIYLKRQSLEIDISKKQADVRKANAEARKADAEARKAYAEASVAEVQALDAQLELHKKLADAGMVLYRDESGNLAITPIVEAAISLPENDAKGEGHSA